MRGGKRTGGRPRLSEEERRDFRKYLVTANRAEADQIEELAKEAGMSASAFLREAALKRAISWRAAAATRRELRRIGVCLHDLACTANAAGQHPELERLKSALAQLEAALQEL